MIEEQKLRFAIEAERQLIVAWMFEHLVGDGDDAYDRGFDAAIRTLSRGISEGQHKDDEQPDTRGLLAAPCMPPAEDRLPPNS